MVNVAENNVRGKILKKVWCPRCQNHGCKKEAHRKALKSKARVPDKFHPCIECKLLDDAKRSGDRDGIKKGINNLQMRRHWCIKCTKKRVRWCIHRRMYKCMCCGFTASRRKEVLVN